MHRYTLLLFILPYVFSTTIVLGQDYPDEEDYPDSLQQQALYFIANHLLADPPGGIIPRFQQHEKRTVFYKYERMYVGEGDIYELLTNRQLANGK